MGFLNSGGQAANSFADNFMKAYQITGHNRLEQDKLAEQKMLQDTIIAEHRDKLKRQQDLDRELQALYAPQPAMGMMSDGGPTVPQGTFASDPSLDLPRNTGQMAPGNPSLEQYLGVLQKYKPEQALTARVSLQNTDERLKAQREISEERNKAMREALTLKLDNAVKLLEGRNDAQSAMLTERLKGAIDALRVRGEEARKTNDEKPANPEKQPGVIDMVRLKKMISDVGDNPGEGDVMLINDAAEKLGYRYESVPGGAYHRELFGMQIPGSKGREPSTYKLVPIGNQGNKTGTTPKKPLSAFGG